MPSTSHFEATSNLGTPKLAGGGQHHTPKSKTSKGLKALNLSSQLLKIGYQRVNIDVNLSENKIEGVTELTVLPTSNLLKSIKLDCRSMTIKDIYVNNVRTTNYIFNDMLYINDDKFFNTSIESMSVNLFDLYSKDLDIHQHHLIRQKLNYVFGESNYDPRESLEFYNGNTEELSILLPDNLKLELTDMASSNYTPGSHAASATPMHLKSRNTANDTYTPIHIKIEYETVNCKNGVNFITPANQDKKYWHAYTTNSVLNVSTSSWVPCIDNLWDRCTWSIEVNIPRTVKDIGNPRIIGSKEAHRNSKSISKRKRSVAYESEMDVDEDDDEEDEDEDLENYDLIVCSGDFNNVKETPHPIDLSKKVVSWSIFNPVCAHHVGWALGCFESLTLSDNVDGQVDEEEEDEDLKGSAGFEDVDKDVAKSPVTIYCFQDQLEQVRNTCIFANNAIDFYSKEFGSYPFSSYAMVFVSNASSECSSFAGLSVISDKLLYPSDIIEPIFTSTEHILESMALQWAGINIVPQTFSDIWCTVGISRFMSFQYLKKLMGTNEYRFKIKKTIDQIVDEDIGRKPLALQYFRFPISTEDLSFIRLKAPIVLFILDRRMTKTDKSFGLSRVLPKLFLQAMSGELPNGTLSTQHFQYVCEKVNRNKLENFFKQWIYGAGVPIFNIVQKFNKKRGVIEMIIRQTQQQDTKKLRPQPKNFINDSIAYLEDEPSYPVQPVFLGPMTIRVHEADGTPYEHIVDLKEGQTKLDIQYNSKFKRLKKVKEEMGEVVNTFSKLGDVLDSPAEIQDWGLAEWVRHEEDILNEPFEWIRVDVDFEWIAKIHVKQADYMYGAQLQYDRDVEAQYEAVKYFGEIEKPAQVHCSALVRTVLDNRYYYGVRIAAASALANFSTESNNYVGVAYLIKAYKKLYCFEGSSIPLTNDFNDFGNFFLQKQIPSILSSVRDAEGEVPKVIKNLILNVIKFNENANNNFQDSFYLAHILESLTNCAVNTNTPLTSKDPLNLGKSSEDPEKNVFVQNVIQEINRLQKLDEWIPSYQNIISRTCIVQKIKLATHGLLQISFEELLYYTLDKYSYDIRVEAFRGLFILGGLKNSSILNYFLKICLIENNVPYFRSKLISGLLDSVCVAAIEGTPSTLDDSEFRTFEKLSDSNAKMANNSTNMVIIEDGSNSEMDNKRDVFARATLNGAIELLRRDYAIGKGLQSILWELVHTSQLSITERRDIFSVCQVLYREVDKFIVRISVPNVPVQELKKKIVSKHLGDGKIIIKREGRFKIQLLNRKLPVQPPVLSKSKVMEAAKIPSVSTSTLDEPLPQSDRIQEPPKLKLSLGFRAPSKDKKVASKKPKESAPPIKQSTIVTLNGPNKNQVTIKFKNHSLHDLPQFPLAPAPIKVGRSSVLVEGSNVTFNFRGAYKSKFKDLVPAPRISAPRYVKILTKKKKLLLSATPFPDSQPAKMTQDILAEKHVSEEVQPVVSDIKNETRPQSEPINSLEALRSSEDLPASSRNSVQIPKPRTASPVDSGRTLLKSSPSPDSSINNKSKIRTKSPSVEPEVKAEKSSTPFSKSGSPFSASPSTPNLKKKKTKIYIHSGDNSKGSTPSDENNSKTEAEKNTTSNSVEEPERPKQGLKLKLNLKR